MGSGVLVGSRVGVAVGAGVSVGTGVGVGVGDVVGVGGGVGVSVASGSGVGVSGGGVGVEVGAGVAVGSSVGATVASSEPAPTVIVARIELGCMRQKYLNSPASPKVKLKVSPLLRVSLSHRPSGSLGVPEVVVWGTPSCCVQTTVVPTSTVRS